MLRLFLSWRLVWISVEQTNSSSVLLPRLDQLTFDTDNSGLEAGFTFQVFCGDEAQGDHEGDFLENMFKDVTVMSSLTQLSTTTSLPDSVCVCVRGCMRAHIWVLVLLGGLCGSGRGLLCG